MREVIYDRTSWGDYYTTKLNKDAYIIERITSLGGELEALERLNNKVFNKMELTECHLDVLEDYQEDFPDSIVQFLEDYKDISDLYIDYASLKKLLNTLRIEFKALARDLASGSFNIKEGNSIED